MSITVRDCLNLPSLKLGEIIAGKKGLTRIVNSVSVLEVVDTNIFSSDNTVNNGDICLTSFYNVRDNINMQCKIIEHLNNMGDACIVLYYVGIYLEDIDRRVVEIADTLDFPIILMPKNRMDFRYSEVIGEVSDSIRRDKNDSKNFVDKITTLVSRLPENKKTLNNLMRIISDNIKCSLLLCDINRTHMAFCTWPISSDLTADFIIDKYDELANSNESQITTTWKDLSITIFKISFSNTEYNNYALYGVDTFGTVTLDDIHQSIELLQIFSKLWDMNEDNILSGSLIPAIMDGDEKKLQIISKKLSLDIQKINATLIIHLPLPNGSQYLSQYKIKRALINAIKTCSIESKKHIIIDAYSIYILCFTNLSLTNDFDEIYIHNIISEIEAITDHYSLSIFANDINISDFRQTYLLYSNTIEAAQKIFPQKKVFSYADIIFANHCNEILSVKSDEYRILKNIITPLILIDDKDNLLETLSAYYLDCDCKLNKASETLFLHRNTIQYRLNKIKEITNYNPLSTLDVTILQLAVGCYRLISETTSKI